MSMDKSNLEKVVKHSQISNWELIKKIESSPNSKYIEEVQQKIQTKELDLIFNEEKLVQGQAINQLGLLSNFQPYLSPSNVEIQALDDQVYLAVLTRNDFEQAIKDTEN